MPLEKYRAKRDFSRTPEPPGSGVPGRPTTRRRAGPREKSRYFFCVQRHLASHLHYDFRLEQEGVLLSWAVPKGPSLDPSVKRLAMHVEDHPIEYGDFEGVIPEGYGAGIVLLWDRGTWTPEVDDVETALRKGELKFSLDGYKLKGSWVLVRTGGPLRARVAGTEGRSWLLIKHRDNWSGPIDITEFAPKSVKSDGDFADILAADMPAIWESSRAGAGRPIGGQAGAMLNEIIRQAAAIRQKRERRPAPKARRATTKNTKSTKRARKLSPQTASARR